MKPETEEQLAQAIRDASGPLAICGGATRGVVASGVALETSGLSGVQVYEPGALTLVVGAGTSVADVEAVLSAEGQRLAFEPMDHRGLLGTTGVPSIGGVVAGNVSGPRRIQVGAARDFALGVRFVDGSGTILKNGGRVMKNVTGYDLVKLMCGSWGTLGVLSEVSLKVLPVPEMGATLQISANTPEDAVAVMSAAMASPYDVSGAAYDMAVGLVYLRLEGFEASVAYRAAQLGAHVKRDRVLATDSASVWRDIRDVAAFHGKTGDVWRVSVKPSDGPKVVEVLGLSDAIMDWAGGLVWCRVDAERDVRAALTGIAGHATLVRADPATRVTLGMFEPEPAAVRALSAGLRAKFDPRGLLNNGVMSRADAA